MNHESRLVLIKERVNRLKNYVNKKELVTFSEYSHEYEACMLDIVPNYKRELKLWDEPKTEPCFMIQVEA
jgi:hypothetical protein